MQATHRGLSNQSVERDIHLNVAPTPDVWPMSEIIVYHAQGFLLPASEGLIQSPDSNNAICVTFSNISQDIVRN